MAHPTSTRRRPTRGIAFASLAGAAMLLPVAPVAAQLLDAPEEIVPACAAESSADPIVDAACDVVDDVVDAAAPVVEAIAPVTEALPLDTVAPLVEEVPAGLPGDDAPADDNQGVPAPPAAPAPQSDSQGGVATADEETEPEPTKVSAAGKAPTEVVEPQAPAADGRVTGTPTIQPANLGSNIDGVRSQNGLTLQPYEAPMVSVPMEYETPMVAPPTTTAAPIQQAAAEAIRFTGAAMVPYTDGSAAWVTATGLGLLGAAGYGMRRRADRLTVTTLDV